MLQYPCVPYHANDDTDSGWYGGDLTRRHFSGGMKAGRRVPLR